MALGSVWTLANLTDLRRDLWQWQVVAAQLSNLELAVASEVYDASPYELRPQPLSPRCKKHFISPITCPFPGPAQPCSPESYLIHSVTCIWRLIFWWDCIFGCYRAPQPAKHLPCSWVYTSQHGWKCKLQFLPCGGNGREESVSNFPSFQEFWVTVFYQAWFGSVDRMWDF